MVGCELPNRHQRRSPSSAGRDPTGRWSTGIRGIPSDDLYLSAVTIGEIQAGIELTRQQGAAKAEEIEGWLESVLATYDILALDAASFRVRARLMHRGSDTLMQAAMIAACATVNRLVVVTRNVREFDQLGVRTLNLFIGRGERGAHE